MRVTAAVLGVTLLGFDSLGSAQAQQATPGPDVPPAGEFRVTPSSGPTGTVVTLTGHLDQPIALIELRCFYRAERIVALGSISFSEPTSDFSIRFEIPAALSVRQPRPGEGGTIETRPDAECAFHAISWHRLLSTSIPFSVTPLGLPVTGLRTRSGDQLPLLLFAGLVGLGVIALTAYAVRSRTSG